MARVNEKSREDFAKGRYVRNAVERYGDVGSSEDEFREGRDKISLEGRAAEHDVEFSDEEVFSIEGDSQTEDENVDDDDARSDAEQIDEDEGEDMRWSRRDYYGGNTIENEEDFELQKAEIEKFERERLEGFEDADFEVGGWNNLPQESESAPTLSRKPPSQMTMEEKNEFMDAIFPELEPLQEEFVSNYALFGPLQLLYDKHPADQVVAAQYTSLSTYLGVLATYFALRSSKSFENESLRDHEIMTSLLTTRQLWERIRGMKMHLEEFEEAPDGHDVADAAVPTPKPDKKRRKVAESRMEDVHMDTGYDPTQKPTRKDHLNVDTLLASLEAEDKRARRKSLRFHASQIDQTAHRRDHAAKLVGDTDLPYRERQKERAMRQNREAVKRRGARGADLDADADADADVDADGKEDHMRDENLAYYNSVAHAGTRAKQEKKAEHDTARDALKQQGYSMEEIAAHGKRALNRQIEKNKGLMPSRGKDQRNPRVKKRKKFAKAQKKLATRKPVVKSDRGAYRGEMSGISSKAVKSVPFH